jgi:hypothetical protein
MPQKICFTIGLLVAGVVVFGQKTGYTIVNRSLTDNGSGGIHLSAADGAGMGWINGLAFEEGTIELEIKGKNVEQQSFVGFAFHGVNDSTYEAVYFRPFNFRSADAEKKVHMVQYIANPKYDWPVLREKFHNQYEKGIEPIPDPADWLHAKIVVTKDKIEVFVNGNETPSLVVTPLVHTGGHLTGFWVGNGADGDFRNLRVNGATVVK